MAAGKRMAALAIGVSNAPPLPHLSGAVNGARAFDHWAKALAYESRLVTDEVEPVTATRLRKELEALLTPDAPGIHRLLIYFAGHGVLREIEEGLWLLSDWNKELRAVAIEALRRRLSLYRVDQVAFFADACRSLPADIQLADLTPDAILGRGPGPLSDGVEVDKFIAAQDGTRTFMIPGANPEDDRCLFSGVLLEGLWGTRPDAFSTYDRSKVTSRSLGKYLRSEVRKVAKTYDCEFVPSISPTFAEGDDVYFGAGASVTPPVFPPWPPANTLIGLGTDGAPGARDSGSSVERFGDQERMTFSDDTTFSDDVASSDEIEFYDEITSSDEMETFSSDEIVASPRSPGAVLEEQLKAQEWPESFEMMSGFVVGGDAVVAIWTTPGVVAETHIRPEWWRVLSTRHLPLSVASPVLIEFAGGVFAAAMALPSFVASVVAGGRGVTALVYRERGRRQIATATEEAIIRLENGNIRADAATDLAVEMRQGKHVDPVRGVISAYLYDSIGDVDSIRRMAFYYCDHRQPIPYDVALLGQLTGKYRGEGVLSVKVPAVKARAPRTDRERGIEWTCSATHETVGIVGGVWPWLRQGWSFLDDPAVDGSTLVLPGLIELTPELTSARFTTFHDSGARRLGALFNLQNRAP